MAGRTTTWKASFWKAALVERRYEEDLKQLKRFAVNYKKKFVSFDLLKHAFQAFRMNLESFREYHKIEEETSYLMELYDSFNQLKLLEKQAIDKHIRETISELERLHEQAHAITIEICAEKGLDYDGNPIK